MQATLSLSPIVRDANEGDAQAIAVIVREAFQKYAECIGHAAPLKALTESEADVIADMKTKHVLVGLVDGEILGSMRYEVIGDIAYITRFAVRPYVQKSGLGKALAHAAMRACRADGVKALALHTATKIAGSMIFYYSSGFYVHSTRIDRGYVRALMVYELGDDQGYDLTPILER